MITFGQPTFQCVDRTTPSTTFQDGEPGDKYTVTRPVAFHKPTQTSKQLVFNAATKTITNINSLSSTAIDTEGFVTDDKFIVGETFKAPGSALNTGTLTIASITDTVITTVEALTNESCTSFIYITTLITGMDFLYNLLGTNQAESYFSLTDPNTLQKYSVSGISATNTTLATSFIIGTSSFSWVTDTVLGVNTSQTTIIGAGISGTYQQQFIITHTYYVTPLILSDQIRNLQQLVYPSYFAFGSCLNYICHVDVYYPCATYAGVIDSGSSLLFNSTTSWFNSNNSGTVPEFSLASISYMDDASGTALSSIDFSKIVDVTITIKSTSGLFVIGTKIILAHVYIPLTNSDYQGTATTLRQNFMHDRAIQTIANTTSANGEFFGTNYSVLQNVVATLIDANNAIITVQVKYSAFLQNFLRGKGAGNRNYGLLLSVQQ